MYAKIKHLRISPRKLNLVAGLVRNMPAEYAVEFLEHTPKKGAQLLLKAIQSAISNAEHNQKKDIANLSIKSIIVNEGVTMKRSRPGYRGSARRILKRTSHVSIELVDVKEQIEVVKKAIEKTQS